MVDLLLFMDDFAACTGNPEYRFIVRSVRFGKVELMFIFSNKPKLADTDA
jgi:hypothetical protein